MQVSQKQWDEFYVLLKRKTGIDFHLYKPQQLQRRLISMATVKGFKSFPEFHKWAGESDANVAWLLDKMAINVSELFRNPERWNELEKHVIPELLTKSRTLRCWSAGCSYGAEAHSLAVLLTAKFPGQHSILGTDIDLAALAQAKESRFNDADMRGVPKEYQPYFKKFEKGWTVEDKVKKHLKFERQNLLADRFSTGFDLILCRNVVIYFTEDAKDELYGRFFDALRPGGYLFVGSTERILKAGELGLESPYPFFYRKPMLAEKTWRNAS